MDEFFCADEELHQGGNISTRYAVSARMVEMGIISRRRHQGNLRFFWPLRDREPCDCDEGGPWRAAAIVIGVPASI